MQVDVERLMLRVQAGEFTRTQEREGSFSYAYTNIKLGHKVERVAWKNTGRVVFMAACPELNGAMRAYTVAPGTKEVRWTPTQTDMNATDWKLI